MRLGEPGASLSVRISASVWTYPETGIRFGKTHLKNRKRKHFGAKRAAASRSRHSLKQESPETTAPETTMR
jgi:hypothetical protein